MKKIIAMVACAVGTCLSGIGEHCRSFMDNGLSTSNKKDNVVSLSVSEWNYVKNMVDTNGWCRLPNFNLVIVITNGCGEVGYHNLPLFPPAAETCHPDKKTGKVEPSSY